MARQVVGHADPSTAARHDRRATTGAASGQRGRRRVTRACRASAIGSERRGSLPFGGAAEALRSQPRASRSPIEVDDSARGGPLPSGEVYVAGVAGNAVLSTPLAAASGANAAFFLDHSLMTDEVAAAVGAAA